MSITETDIQKLASLSRMKLSSDEITQFAGQIDAILGYVEQIKEVSSADTQVNMQNALNKNLKTPDSIPHRNALREDSADKALNPDPSVLVDSAPASQDGFVKVKKILN